MPTHSRPSCGRRRRRCTASTPTRPSPRSTARTDARRDFTYIDDVIKGCLGALDTAGKSTGSKSGKKRGPASLRVYNLGNTSPVPVTRMVAILEKLLGHLRRHLTLSLSLSLSLDALMEMRGGGGRGEGRRRLGRRGRATMRVTGTGEVLQRL